MDNTHSTNAARIRDLSYFFPAHNEEANVEAMVSSALDFLPEVVEEFEIIVVDDGSRDRTKEIAESLAAAHPQVRVVSHEVNRGYGGALKSGIGASRHSWIFFTDGDRQFDVRELRTLLDKMDAQTTAVIGYRMDRKDPWHRSLNARLYKGLIRILFGLKVRDIDCAFKLIRADQVKPLPLKSNGALISAEMLIRMKKRGTVIREVGVGHFPRVAGEQSGANLRVILRMFRELFALYGELRREAASGRKGPA